MSSDTPVYIKEVEVENFKCFKGENKFSFVDESGDWCRWTVFLGDNNSGKTNLLKAIASLEPSRKIGKDSTSINFFGEIFDIGKTSLFLMRPSSSFSDSVYSYSYNLTRAVTVIKYIAQSLSIYGYGVIRDIERKGISNNKETLNAENLFYNTKLINFEDWLFQLDYAAKNGQAQAGVRLGLLKKIITSEIFPEIENFRFKSDKKLNNYIEFKVADDWHKLSELGYGYQATLSWMVDFCKKMFDRYPDSDNPLKEPAVLLIDEIDLHLHPQWQRNIIKYLSDIFTTTQFIVTTHSPFIMQSMEEVNLYTLKHEKNKTRVNHLGVKSFIGWGIEAILSEVMGLDNNIQTDVYQKLRNRFDEALDNNNYTQAKQAYDELMVILHPRNSERKLLEIQLSQLDS